MGALDGILDRIGIEPSERALCGWAGLCLLLLGSASFGLTTAAETLFLKRVGVAQLPWVLLASSGFLVATTALASRGLVALRGPLNDLGHGLHLGVFG